MCEILPKCKKIQIEREYFVAIFPFLRKKLPNF
jgi:hypothetical protein